MKICKTGDHVVGGLDRFVHVDKAIPNALHGIRAGGWGFLDRDGTEIVGPGVFPGDAAWTIFGLTLGESAPHRVDNSQPDNANWFGAGGGAWAAAGTAPINVYGNTLPGGSLPGAGFYTVGRDGVVVVKPQYHGAGGIALYFPNGSRADFANAIFVAYNDGWLLYRESGTLFATDVLSGETIEARSLGLVFCICRGPEGACYLVEWQESGERTVLHHAQRDRGWVVAHGPHDFNADVCLVTSSGLLRVSTSYGQGERPNEVQDYLINTEAATIDLGAPVEPPIDPPVIPPIEPPIEPPIDPPTEPPIEPPIDPPVDPIDPIPPIEEVYPMRAAIATRVLNFRDGKISNGFEERRAKDILSDETAEIRQYGADVFALISPNGQEMASVTPDGKIEYRLVSEMPDGPGPFETFHRKTDQHGVFVEAIELKRGVEGWEPVPPDRAPVEFAAVPL